MFDFHMTETENFLRYDMNSIPNIRIDNIICVELCPSKHWLRFVSEWNQHSIGQTKVIFTLNMNRHKFQKCVPSTPSIFTNAVLAFS